MRTLPEALLLLEGKIVDALQAARESKREAGLRVYSTMEHKPIVTPVRLGEATTISKSFDDFLDDSALVLRHSREFPTHLVLDFHTHPSSEDGSYFPSFPDFVHSAGTHAYFEELLRVKSQRLSVSFEFAPPLFLIGDEAQNLFAYWFPMTSGRMAEFREHLHSVIQRYSELQGNAPDAAQKSLDALSYDFHTTFRQKYMETVVAHQLCESWKPGVKSEFLQRLLEPHRLQYESLVILNEHC